MSTPNSTLSNTLDYWQRFVENRNLFTISIRRSLNKINKIPKLYTYISSFRFLVRKEWKRYQSQLNHHRNQHQNLRFLLSLRFGVLLLWCAPAEHRPSVLSSSSSSSAVFGNSERNAKSGLFVSATLFTHIRNTRVWCTRNTKKNKKNKGKTRHKIKQRQGVYDVLVMWTLS